MLKEEPTEEVTQNHEEPTEVAAEEPQVNILIAKMKARHPEIEDDGELMTKAHDYMSELEDYRDRNEVSNSELIKIARLNPGLIKTIQMMKEGASWEEAVARNVDLSAIPTEGEPDYEKWAKSASERESEYNRILDEEERLTQNRQNSIQNLKDFAAENGWSEEQTADFYTKIVSPTLEAIANLDFSIDFYKTLHKAITAEEEKAAAMEDGILKGKNMTAEEIMQPEVSGDGLPKASSTVESPAPTKKKSYIESLMG